jgi:signal transduction histidine kinase
LLERVLANLVANALRHTDGPVEVRGEEAEGQVRLAVVDHGPGVPQEFRRHLFNRYTRDTATAEQVIGTGLGLFISRELAHANGGELLHREAEPQGSEFVLRLPGTRPGPRAVGVPSVAPAR